MFPYRLVCLVFGSQMAVISCTAENLTWWVPARGSKPLGLVLTVYMQLNPLLYFFYVLYVTTVILKSDNTHVLIHRYLLSLYPNCFPTTELLLVQQFPPYGGSHRWKLCDFISFA